MANMSYCRFENTLSDLRDCYEHLEDNPDDMSDTEREAREQMIELCCEIAGDFGDMERPYYDEED